MELSALFVSPVRSLAQSVGSVTGTVTDGAGKPLAKARITVSGPTSRSAEINSLVLSSVEVSKGPGKVSNTIEDAIGGTVNFRTPSITPGLSGQLIGGYDSFNGNSYGLRLFDTFGKVGILMLPSRAEFRLSAATYGANNSFGQPGFTEFDVAIRVPLRYDVAFNAGASNLFNTDNYQVGGIYDGGCTYANLSGGAGRTDYSFVQPRTVYFQLQKAFGR